MKLLISILFISVTYLYTEGVQRQTGIDIETNNSYICPPCGCTGDHLIYEEPGTCNYCSMKLIERKSGFTGEVQHYTSHIFRYGQHYSDYYLRVIYPFIFLFFLVPILIIRNRRSMQVILCCLAIVSISLYMLKFQLYGANYSIYNTPIGAFLPVSFLLIFWPGVYLFLKLIAEQEVTKELVMLHFAPGVLFFLWQLYLFYLYLKGEGVLYNGFDTYLVPIEQVIFVIGGYWYGIGIANIYRNNEFKDKGHHEKLYQWTSKFAFLVSSVMLLFLIVNFYLYEGMVAALDYHLLWLFFVVFILWWSYHIWMGKESFFPKARTSYKMSEKLVSDIKEKFDQLLTNEEIISNQKLNLSIISELIGVRPRLITEFLNLVYQKKFYDIVNQARAELAKEKLLSSELEHLTNEAIGNMCGFASKTTFIKSFKTLTGCTPGQFKRNQQVVSPDSKPSL